MPEVPLERLESMVGEPRSTIEDLTVEAGKVEEFARALKNDNPAYRSARAAKEQGFEGIPAPITFLRTSIFPRYEPDPGGFELDVDRFTLGFDLGFDLRYRIHGEQEYEIRRPLYVGDTLSGETTLVDVSEREGSNGTLTVAVLETEYRDQRGEVVAIERKTILEVPTIAGGDSGSAGERPVPPETTHRETSERTDVYRTTCFSEDVAVGDSGPELVERLDLKDFVRYAGASCGFDRIHYDRDFVRDAGYPDVFAHGMLLAGVVEHMITDWLGLSTIRRFRTRFINPLWPGDTLTVRGEIVEKRETETGATVEVDLVGTNQHEETVVKGEVMADLPARTA